MLEAWRASASVGRDGASATASIATRREPKRTPAKPSVEAWFDMLNFAIGIEIGAALSL